MKKKARLAAAESEIMEGVWEVDKQTTVREIHQKLYPNGEKAYTTVQTIMNILTEKGFLSREKIGMVNFYTPRVSRGEVTLTELRSLVSRMFDGSFSAMAAHLVNSGELTDQELDHLKTLISEKERQEGDKR